MRHTKKIGHTAQYQKKDSNGWIIALSFDIPSEKHTSVVQFYNVSFDNTEYTKMDYIPHNILSPYTLGFAQLRVSTMKVLPESDLLLIAVDNFGLVVAGMVEFKLVRTISFVKQMRYQEFRVMMMVVQDPNTVNLVFDKFGIISLEIDNIDVFKDMGCYKDRCKRSYKLTEYFNFLL